MSESYSDDIECESDLDTFALNFVCVSSEIYYTFAHTFLFVLNRDTNISK